MTFLLFFLNVKAILLSWHERLISWLFAMVMCNVDKNKTYWLILSTLNFWNHWKRPYKNISWRLYLSIMLIKIWRLRHDQNSNLCSVYAASFFISWRNLRNNVRIRSKIWDMSENNKHVIIRMCQPQAKCKSFSCLYKNDALTYNIKYC